MRVCLCLCLRVMLSVCGVCACSSERCGSAPNSVARQEFLLVEKPETRHLGRVPAAAGSWCQAGTAQACRHRGPSLNTGASSSALQAGGAARPPEMDHDCRAPARPHWQAVSRAVGGRGWRGWRRALPLLPGQSSRLAAVLCLPKPT